ncbi:APC family permease [Dysgonomonas macrotermitis]|uniref:Amino acid/polyamine/organocation transporter, APC superfamily n=1 Tax=Dysgonomonas macrotermitis TaxID=1346286 RepID=A0A1M5C8C9_9BACT|nr:amino acid permease [Dysgonomonas macrotermitis]SHF51044.1 amino acid/polyamine/organocation transporter, APC superfamily [Dysgonomonas macrotermitis]
MDVKSLFRRKDISRGGYGEEISDYGLKRVLGVKDLTLFGIAAIIGAGIFSTIGRAAFNGGPAVSLLFVFVAFACVFTALCYAQFASMISTSGSAYTYTYATLGELFAWAIGWALILEYAVSNMVIAISWSGYFTTMLEGFGLHWPHYLSIGYLSAYEAYKQALSGATDLPSNVLLASETYRTAPVFMGMKVLVNIPAGAIIAILSVLVFVGIKESKVVNNLLVFLKIGIILLVIFAGCFFVKPENWSPFAPNGIQGVLGGVAAVFFSFIGFDSISTTAEECKNPQRDMPRAMLYCLAVCTVLYIGITLVLTGMVNFKELGVDDPLAYVFQKVDMDMIAGIVSVSAVVAITSAILVFQIGQPRIWMTMSRDGLLWPRFGKVHPKYKTPTFATIVAGILVCVPSLFLDMQFVVDLTSVGTFFAFITVCSGVLYLDYKGYSKKAKFKVPYINGQYIVGLLFLAMAAFFLFKMDYKSIIEEKPLLLIFWLTWIGLSIAAYRFRFSLLPTVGILINLYLMTELGWSNWYMFLIWLIIGLIVYFLYGHKKSKLAASNKE